MALRDYHVSFFNPSCEIQSALDESSISLSLPSMIHQYYNIILAVHYYLSSHSCKPALHAIDWAPQEKTTHLQNGNIPVFYQITGPTSAMTPTSSASGSTTLPGTSTTTGSIDQPCQGVMGDTMNDVTITDKDKNSKEVLLPEDSDLLIITTVFIGGKVTSVQIRIMTKDGKTFTVNAVDVPNNGQVDVSTLRDREPPLPLSGWESITITSSDDDSDKPIDSITICCESLGEQE